MAIDLSKSDNRDLRHPQAYKIHFSVAHMLLSTIMEYNPGMNASSGPCSRHEAGSIHDAKIGLIRDFIVKRA